MKVAVLVAEIGSTTTVVNAFDGIGGPCPKFLGQGQAFTSVLGGDVTVGLRGAVEDLRRHLGVSEISWGEMFATSSAAGGLRMSVHGLVYDMTVRAAKEAALGAGGLKSQADVLALAARLELGAANAYLGVIPSFGSHDLAKVAARLAADETMHWTLLANALGRPVPAAALSFGA